MKMTSKRSNSVIAAGVMLVVLLLGAVGWAKAAPVLFGSAYNGPGGAADLYRIDPANGQATLIGPIGFNRVSAIDFNAAGVLFGVGSRPADGAQVLLTIDTATGAGTEVGPLGTDAFTQDISFRNGDGTLFSHTESSILTIDTGSGATTLVGDTGDFLTAGNGLAFSASDTLLNANDVELLSVDQTTAVRTVVTSLQYPDPPLVDTPRANGMDFDPATGTLWASVADGFNPDTVSYLGTIDATTGDVTIVGQTVKGLDAVAVQAIPEPGSLALFLVGGFPLVWIALRRRKPGSNLS